MIVSAWSAWSLVITRKSSMTDDDRALMTLDDVADCRAFVATVRYWIARGRLRSLHPGRRQLVRREDLLRFLDSERASTVTPISISHDRAKWDAWPKRATPVRAALVAELARSRRAPWPIAGCTDSRCLHERAVWSPATCCAGTRRRLATVQTSRRPEPVSPTMLGQGTEPVCTPRRDDP